MEYNKENNITPKTIKKTVRSLPSDDVLPSKSKKKAGRSGKTDAFGEGVALTASERSELIASLEKEMKQAALLLEFERAAELRDRIAKLKKEG